MANNAWAIKLSDMYAGEPQKLSKLMTHIGANPKHQVLLGKLVSVDGAFKNYVQKVYLEVDGAVDQHLDEIQLAPKGHTTGLQLRRKEACSIFDSTGTAVLHRPLGAATWTDKLLDMCAGDPEKFSKLMMHISENTKHQLPLSKLVKADEAFKKYIDKVDLEINGTLAQYLDENTLAPAEHIPGFQVQDKEACTIFNATGAAVFERVPPEHKGNVLQAIIVTLKLGSSETVRSLGGELSELGVDRLKRFAKYGGVALMAAQLSWEAITGMKEWWTGKISGRRAAKQVVDCMGSLSTGLIAGGVGCMIGAAAPGPWSAFAGAAVGGIVGSVAGARFTDALTQWFFDVPKDVALENAYNFLGLRHNSDNCDVNKHFKESCLKYHPDKGGSAEDFQKLQVSMHIIRLARGQA